MILDILKEKKNRESNMKKLLALLLVFTLVIGCFAGCSKGGETSTSSSDPVSSEDVSSEEPVSAEDESSDTDTAEGEDEIGNTYFSTLKLNPDGTYVIALDANGAPAYDEEGTFRTEETMNGISIVLVDAAGIESAGVVSDTLNITHNVDYAFNTLGFQYEKGE